MCSGEKVFLACGVKTESRVAAGRSRRERKKHTPEWRKKKKKEEEKGALGKQDLKGGRDLTIPTYVGESP